MNELMLNFHHQPDVFVVGDLLKEFTHAAVPDDDIKRVMKQGSAWVPLFSWDAKGSAIIVGFLRAAKA